MSKAGFHYIALISMLTLCSELSSPALSLAIAEGGEDRFAAPRTTSEKSRDLGHFEKDGARNIFGKRVTPTEKQELQYFKAVREVEVTEEVGAATGASLTNVAAERQPEVAEPTSEKALSARESLIKQFGDPTKEAPVQAVESAPGPFKAMMASLEAGDDELAFKYAQQHVKYLRKLQDRSTRVMGLTGLAMEKEGLVERGTWSNNPQFKGDVELLNAEESASPASEAQQIDLSSKAKEMLAKAFDEEGNEVQADGATAAPKKDTVGNLVVDEKFERARVRQNLAGKVQPDPSKKVDIYFFFRPRDTTSQEMARRLQKIYEEGVKRGGINLIGLSLSPLGSSEERAFRKFTGIKFALKSGEKLAGIMGVKRSPSIVLMGQTVGKPYLIESLVPLYEIEETLSFMEGR